MADITCPRCGNPLVKQTGKYGITYRCERCGGMMAGAAVLRNAAGEENYKKLWRGMVLAGQPGEPHCGICGGRMMTGLLSAPDGNRTIALDICTKCQCIWFDRSEFESSARPASRPAPVRGYVQQGAASPDPGIKREGSTAHEASAVPSERGILREYYDEICNLYNQIREGPDEPETLGESLRALAGLPGFDEEKDERFFPWVTLSLAVIILAISIWGFYEPLPARIFSFIPADALRYFGANFLSNVLVHADVWHLLGNLYFLYILGSRAEKKGGMLAAALAFMLGAAGGNLLHLMIFPGSIAPVLGASGGVSALTGYILLAMPREKINVFGFIRFIGAYKLRMPVFIWATIWLIGQSYTFIQLAMGESSVAATAHIGGFITGMAIYLIVKLLKPEKKEPANVWPIP